MRIGYRLQRFLYSRNSNRAHTQPEQKIRTIRFVLLAAVFLVAAVYTTYWVDAHLRPIISQLASARVHYLATKAINDAIDEKIVEGEINYDSIVHFEKNTNGEITALKTNMAAINRLRSEITGEVLENIEQIGPSELAVPLGNALSNDFLSGRGPMIPIRIVPVGTAHATFENVFSAAGINQTRHQILMNVVVDISVLTMGHSESSQVSVAVSLAETIIVGTVPDNYTNLDEGIFHNGESYNALTP